MIINNYNKPAKNKLTSLDEEAMINLIHLKYVNFEMDNGKYIVTLTDISGYDILRGYGNTLIEAFNDMHHNLI